MNSNRRVLALIGASLLMLGFFTPLVSFLGLVGLSYFDLVRVSARFITGAIVLGLGAVSLFLALKNLYRPLLITGIAALVVLGFDFLTYKSALSKLAQKGNGGIETIAGGGGPQFGQFIEQAAGVLVQPTWGMFILVGGAVLLVIAGAMKDAPARDWRDSPPPPASYM